MEDGRYIGTVIWFKKKYGFIEWSINNIKQTDLFCYWSDLSSSEMPGFRKLTKGQSVSFKLGTNHHGQPKAIEVVVIK